MKPFFRIALCMACLLARMGLFAQKQHEKWVFSYNTALDFSSGAPVFMPGSAMVTNEGCVSMADRHGNLLFYTNGVVVYDRNHQLMPNGYPLGGHSSSTQSALAVPFPGDSTQYYLFTIYGPHGDWYPGLTYSVLDLSLQGGLGDITLKNIPLVDSTVEKLTATRHANGVDTWVVCHEWNTDAFYAWLVTCGGIEGPVISRLGLVPTFDASSVPTTSALGAMRISPDGKHLASVGYALDVDDKPNGWVEYFDFDNATGIVSNPALLPTPGIRAYGVAFSPSSRYLYFSVFGVVNGVGYSNIQQLDLEAADIPASLDTVQVSMPTMSTLQLGPDGRLYIARLSHNSISAIPFPDSPAPACGFVMNAASLFPGFSMFGLPNHWDTYPGPEVFGFSDTTHCREDSLVLAANVNNATGWLWSNGTTEAQALIDQAGQWTVEVHRACDTLRDTFWVAMIPCDTIPGDTVPVDTATSDSCLTLPNVFTPNADGINDQFLPKLECVPAAYSLHVFDRWGNAVFATQNPLDGWDGGKCPDGVYYCRVDWHQAAGPPQRTIGNLVLLR